MTNIRLILEDNREITFELYEDEAPITVKNFLDLIDKKYFDGLVFHRIIKDFMAQAGGYMFDDEKREISESPKTKSIKGEFKSNGVENNLKHEVGVISMARTNIKDSASSQFFIMTSNSSYLDGEYAAFGKAYGEESFEVIEELNNVKTVYAGAGLTDFPYPIIRIKTIERIKGE